MGALRLTYQNRGNFYLSSAKSISYSYSNLELSNHLGNVLSVISDKVIPHPSGATVAYYKADILQAMDYSPFGVKLKGRNLKKTGLSDKFRFGYQGSEADDEMKGEGNSYTTFYRQLDPRLGRWLSIDPKSRSMPWQSTYCSMDNNPISYNDIKGDKVVKEKTEGATNKEFRKFKQVIRQMRRASESFNKMYKDLDESGETYKFIAAPDFKVGADGEYIPKDKTDDGTHHIMIDVKSKEYASTIAHEVGHAFRRMYGLDIASEQIALPTRPEIVISLNKKEQEQYKKDVEKYNAEYDRIRDKNFMNASDFKKEFELAALHIQNIVVSELKTSKRFKGSEFQPGYYNMEQYEMQYSNGKFRPVPSIKNVISNYPEEYYNGKLDIYKENGIKK